MTKKKQRLLVLSCMPYYDEKGSSLRTHSSISALLANYDIDAVVYRHGVDIDLLGLKIYRTPKWFNPHLKVSKASISKIILDFFVFIKAVQLLIFYRYSHIHVEDFEAGTIGFVLSKIFRKKYVYNLHNRITDNWEISGKKTPWFVRQIEKVIVDNAHFIIVNWAMYLKEPLLNQKNSFLFYDSMTLETTDVDFQIPNDYLFYAGNFEPYQGVSIFLTTYAQSDCKVPVLIAGTPTDEIVQLIADLNITHLVHLLGRRPIEETNTFIKNSSYCILPRIAGKQPSMKLIHYLSWEKPVIANDISCNHELLKDFQVGLFYSNERQLIDILKTIDNEKNINKAKLQNAAKYIKKFSSVKSLTSFYAKKINS